MIAALVTGRLVARPEARTGTSGRPFVRCRLHVHDGQSHLLVLAVAFAQEARDVLLALDAGAVVCLSGLMKLGVWSPDNCGEPRPSVSLVIDAVMTNREYRAADRAVRKARRDVRQRKADRMQRSLDVAKAQWHQVDGGDGLDVGQPLDF